ncbi:MAG: hypothetical protein K9J81_06940 [Desulfohalobiaceae bacterium]|nr:hypothetical protein [Desulfohalobiaceae bacterium]
MLEDGVNGYFCALRDAGDLALKMQQMLELSPEKRAAMGRAGRDKMIREFDESIVLNAYLQAIETLTKTQLPIRRHAPSV